MLGKIKNYEVNDNKIIITMDEGNYNVEIIRDDIIRFNIKFTEKNYISKAIEENPAQDTDFSVEKETDAVVISTDLLTVKVYDECKTDIYDKDGNLICEDYRGKRTTGENLTPDQIAQLRAEGHSFNERGVKYRTEVIKTMESTDCFYGLGDKAGFLNKREYDYVMQNSDISLPNDYPHTKALYKSIPFLITKNSVATYGLFFDNTFTSFFNLGEENLSYFYYAINDGDLDYYFIYGPDMKKVLGGYAHLTGYTPVPQLWTLGYHQSRWGYITENDFRSIAKQMRDNDLPCDVLHYDIHYMDNYKVFTWNKENFEATPKQLGEDLKKDGFKRVCILDPGVKKEEGYHVYDQAIENDYFIKDNDGNVYINEVWPGEAAFPDFSNPEVRNWWADLQKEMIDFGADGIWCDMNEPASFKGNLPLDLPMCDENLGATQGEMHNVYGHHMATACSNGLKKHNGKRPFVITRACYSGIQKYSTAWTGDNHSEWDHLQWSIPQICNLGLSGLSYAGADVGGFAGNGNTELFARWFELGCFYPLFRNHACFGTRRQELWTFGKEVLDISRKYLKLRYKLLPYIYDTFVKNSKTGLPVMRAMVLEFPEDKNCESMNDQFMFGEDILVSPVVNQGEIAKRVYLPEGQWYDFWTNEVIEGGRYIIKDAPLDVCPMYVKAGSIIPTYPEMSYVGEIELDTLNLMAYPDKNGNCRAYKHYTDNGEDFKYLDGEYNEYEFKVENGELKTQLNHKGYKEYKNINLI
ncbi:MAG: glycoside hydrolase family 31 protein [Clostridia bacterium]|nr:glycoside hydrolase family 31 protein [Clostridia bacterium]